MMLYAHKINPSRWPTRRAHSDAPLAVVLCHRVLHSPSAHTYGCRGWAFGQNPRFPTVTGLAWCAPLSRSVCLPPVAVFQPIHVARHPRQRPLTLLPPPLRAWVGTKHAVSVLRVRCSDGGSLSSAIVRLRRGPSFGRSRGGRGVYPSPDRHVGKLCSVLPYFAPGTALKPSIPPLLHGANTACTKTDWRTYINILHSGRHLLFLWRVLFATYLCLLALSTDACAINCVSTVMGVVGCASEHGNKTDLVFPSLGHSTCGENRLTKGLTKGWQAAEKRDERRPMEDSTPPVGAVYWLCRLRTYMCV